MGRKKIRMYTQREWDSADPLDRLYMHLMEPERWSLSENEEVRLEKLRATWTIVLKKASPRERIKLIVQTCQCTDRHAFRLMEDAKRLFAETLDIDHDLELKVNYHRFMEIYDRGIKLEDLDVARKALESGMKIRAEMEARQPKTQKVYAQITFTDSPAALQARNADHVEFEEINEESLLELEAVGVSASH